MNEDPFIIYAKKPNKTRPYKCSVRLSEHAFRLIEDLVSRTNKSRDELMSELIEQAAMKCVIRSGDPVPVSDGMPVPLIQ